jgi:hypothetical protein
MEVNIGEVVASVKAIEGSSLVSPDVMAQLVTAVLRALEEKQAHQDRVRAERRVTGGVAWERESEE